MKVILKKLAALFVLVNLTSCVGYGAYASFTDLSDKKNDGTKPAEENCLNSTLEVNLLFEGEPVNFEYERIGLIESEGGIDSNDEDVLKELKARAKEKCCDMVIGVKKGKGQTEAGLLFITDFEKSHKYSTIIYSGIGVKRKVTTN
ncbi:hypothetical protein NAT51_05670 [Flavobacterium amniphilum]|uniref:hypothetical protein n=1 Tax=Flavobacterium amniphilum TaxID=1834035 RepID=UPI002029CF96|nr:hypothetical protein [Flavobacterium amniphilum]MCL9804996.1 hypothetical protein [Flavobacterium amniphilum]